MDINKEIIDTVYWIIGCIIFWLGALAIFTFIINTMLNIILKHFTDQKLFIEFAQWRINKKKQDEIKLRFPNIQREDDM